MAARKECLHCRRSIDAAARVCPYCNREQDASRHVEPRPTVPLPPIESAPQPRVTPKKIRREWSTRALLIFAVAAVLMASFAVGGLVYGLGKRGEPNKSDEERATQLADNVMRPERDFPQLTLVPEADPTATIGRSITSAPVPDPDHKLPAEFQRSDATALPATEYARIIEQSRAPADRPPPMPVSVDPRTVSTPPPGAGAVAPQSEESTASPQEPSEVPKRESIGEREDSEARADSVVRTKPVPIYQPLPGTKDWEGESGTMRFRLTIAPSGRVTEIRVLETMPGMTGKMIAAIQKWRFKPATENGVPVEGTFMVDISFNPSE